MIKNESEIWRAHPEYTGIEVSTFGRVRTLDRVVPCRGNGTRFVKERILKQQDNGTGYLQVGFYKDGKQVRRYVHQLVAKTFIENPNNWPEVNHKDNDRTNNCVDNLEFCTRSYNMKYKDKFGISNTESQGHPVFAINLTTLEVSHFRSQGESSRELGVNNSSITAVIKGRRNQTHGYWFVSDDGHAVDVVKSKLHDIGGTGLKIKHRASIKKIFS